MKIVFFGTPSFAAEILAYLLDQSIQIAAVVTQPDRPKGRSLQLAPSPVKALIQERAPAIPLYQPEKSSNEEFLSQIAACNADLFVVVAFGQILPQKLLDIPPLGCINVHTSLLPKYRGAAPIQRALFNGEPETGVSIQKMVRQLDAGDIIAVEKLQIPLEMTCGELEASLCAISKTLLVRVLNSYKQGIPPGIPQDPAQVTYAAKVELEEGEIHWERPAREIHNLIRAFSPRPGAWCMAQSKRLKILRSRPHSASEGRPGQILSIKEALIGCGQGALELLQVQPEGKKAMSGAEWLRGQKFSSNSLV